MTKLDIWDEIIDGVNKELPPFNEYTLAKFRKEQIDKCIAYMSMTNREATKLYNGDLEFLGHRILNPEERLRLNLDNPKFQSSVDITQTELMDLEFQFAYQKQKFVTHLRLPYLYNNAIVINGSKYYIQFALTDKVFYHISRDNGIGIKVLRSHMRFWRNLRYHFTSVTGMRYTDYIIQTKIHSKSYKYLSDDLHPSIVLYPLAKFGWAETLRRYHIDPDKLTIVNDVNMEDDANEYFVIRERSKSVDQQGLFLKVHKSLLDETTTPLSTNIARFIANVHYSLQYFTKVNTTMYKSNLDLPKFLTVDEKHDAWKVIMGKTIYGLNYDNEIKVCGHAEQHLESIDTYLDPHTKQKLVEIGVHCHDVYELIDYVFMNIDNYVVNYVPANLYRKRINVLDLLLGNIVNGLFLKVYSQTNNRKGDKGLINFKDVVSLFRSGYKAISQIYKCNSVAASNPAQYNDNYALTIGCRKTRATFSTSSSGTKGENKSKQGKQSNLINNPAHRYHQSMNVIESIYNISHQNPSISGSLSPFCPISPTGDILIEDYVEDLNDIIPYVITK